LSAGYFAIADSEPVRQAQIHYGSRSAQARAERHGDPPLTTEPRDRLTLDEREFIALRDGFYLASVSDTGWPYVQFRGGPPGFVHTPDPHTLAWADFRGNRQYISTGNISHDDRVALFFMDYPNRTRLKLFGRASIVDTRDHPELSAPLAVSGYRAVVERAVTVTVVSYDWNCPQHITPRFTLDELHQLDLP
jgi:predicted pyridoxine 5'-phosphate oxidase superfamily flavin-nucleotide-binding protein